MPVWWPTPRPFPPCELAFSFTLARLLNSSSLCFLQPTGKRLATLQVEDMMVEINADKEEAEVVRVKVEAEEAMANEKVEQNGVLLSAPPSISLGVRGAMHVGSRRGGTAY